MKKTSELPKASKLELSKQVLKNLRVRSNVQTGRGISGPPCFSYHTYCQ